MIIIYINYSNNHLKYTHSWILKLDISTQASSWQQATVSLASHCHNEGDSNWQHTDSSGRQHSSYTQWINDHLDEAIKINDSSAATETWRSTSLEECRALSQMMKWAQDSHDRIISHTSHYSQQQIHCQTHWNS